MPQVTRRPKANGNLTFEGEVRSGKLDIIDTEVDGDFDQIYNFVNGGLDDFNFSGSPTRLSYSKLNLTGQIRDADVSLPAAFGNTGGIGANKIRLPFPTTTPVITSIDQLAPGVTIKDSEQQPANFAAETQFTYPSEAEHVLVETTWTARGGFWIALGVVHLYYPIQTSPATHFARLRLDSSGAGVPNGQVMHTAPTVCGIPDASRVVVFPMTGVVFGHGFSPAGVHRIQLTGQVTPITLAGAPVATSRRIWIMEQA